MADPANDKTEVSDKSDDKQQQQPAPTPEEIAQMAKDNAAAWFSDEEVVKPKKKEEKPAEKAEEKPPEKAAEKPKEEKGEEKPAKLAGQEGEAPAENNKEKPKEAPRQAPLNDDQIDDVADRVVDRLKPEEKEKPEEKAKDPYEGFAPREQRKLRALDYLSNNDPRFKGRDLAKEAAEFWRKENDYISNWEKEHKGEAFNELDPEHADFYRRNEPAGVTDDDIEEARVDMKVDDKTKSIQEKAEKRAEKAIQERLAPIERQRVLDENAGNIRTSINDAVAGLVSGVLPDAIGEGGFTQEVVTKIKDQDPEAFDLLSHESAILNVRIRELESVRLFGIDGFDKEKVVRIDGEKIAPHADILDTAVDLEERILAQPKEDQIVEGKVFMRRADRAREQKRIIDLRISQEEKARRLKALDDRYWSIGLDDIREAFIADSAKKVKKQLEFADRRIKRVTEKKAKSDEKPEPIKNDEKVDKPKQKAPASVAAESAPLNINIPGNKQEATQAEINSKAWFD